MRSKFYLLLTVWVFWVYARANAQASSVQSNAGGFETRMFIDVEARAASRKSLTDRGFTLNDASLSFTKNLKSALVYVDLPFASEAGEQSNEFEFASQRAEAFLLYERTPFQFKAGQYATFFGYEANSSRERFFADAGPIRDYVLPKTHMGAQFIIGSEASKILFQIVNPNGASALDGENVEGGVGVRFEAEPFDFTAGATFHESETSYPGNRTDALVELRMGMGREKLRLDGAVNLKRSAGSDKTGDAIGVMGRFRINEMWAAGARVEHLRDIYTVLPTGAGTFDSVTSVGVGGMYRFQTGLWFRGDLTVSDMKAPGIDEMFEVLTLSAVADF